MATPQPPVPPARPSHAAGDVGPDAPSGPPPRLWRSRAHRMLAGVLGGLAEKFGMEPFPLRALYAMLTLVTAIVPGVAIYVGIWAITRSHGPEASHPSLWRSRSDTLVSGVVGGLSEKLGLPSALARVSYAILTIATGFFPGTILYLLLWMFAPPLDTPPARDRGR